MEIRLTGISKLFLNYYKQPVMKQLSLESGTSKVRLLGLIIITFSSGRDPITIHL